MISAIKCDTVRNVIDTINEYKIARKDIINIFPFNNEIIIIYEIK